MSTTDSLPVGSQSQQSPLLQPAQDEASLREGLELGEGVRRLGKMIGLKSINRNMQAEDAMVKRQFEIGDAEIGGGDVAKPGDDVEAMAARDITINHNYPAPPTPMQPATPPVTPEQPSKLADLAKKAALIAAMGGSGAGGAWLYQYFNKPAAPVVPDVTQPDFNLLPPDPAPGTTK